MWSLLIYWIIGLAPSPGRFFIFLAYMVGQELRGPRELKGSTNALTGNSLFTFLTAYLVNKLSAGVGAFPIHCFGTSVGMLCMC